ncbi:hypothetical protein EVAR_395_1 [Eumeta japonica]|uniref:Uncharacterized protein n=1 Tax=Eumeta variegata TaxID=151549 RepID=A0A4C1SCA9_EUMVA|nr:hypothetical protein EVAR_395_1 [Eumeta japonica]
MRRRRAGRAERQLVLKENRGGHDCGLVKILEFFPSCVKTGPICIRTVRRGLYGSLMGLHLQENQVKPSPLQIKLLSREMVPNVKSTRNKTSARGVSRQSDKSQVQTAMLGKSNFCFRFKARLFRAT